jgi:hypothetical protein
MKKICILFIVVISLMISCKSVELNEEKDIANKETVLELLWTSQRHRLIKWAETLKVLIDNKKNINFNNLKNEELREFIHNIITRVNSEKINILNRNPQMLDKAASELRVTHKLSSSDSKYGKMAENGKLMNIIPLLKFKIENMSRNELIELVKVIHFHVIRGREYLSEGVLQSLEKMNESQMIEWLFRKIVQHPDLNTIELLNQIRL